MVQVLLIINKLVNKWLNDRNLSKDRIKRKLNVNFIYLLTYADPINLTQDGKDVSETKVVDSLNCKKSIIWDLFEDNTFKLVYGIIRE